MKFSEFNLNENLQKGIDEAGFTECMPVQAEALAHTIKGRDALVQSQTGTGKTAAFLIAIFQHMLDENSPIKKKRALIITPTRELAAQIEKDAKILGKHLNFSIGSFYGGVGYAQQEKLLDGGVNIIVGTPGRLLDFCHQGKIDFNSMGFFVIDEADRMFDMGFLQDIREILDRVTTRQRRMFMLFSATLDARTKAVAYEYMKDPAKVEIQPEMVTVDKITQVLYHVAEKEKLSLMLGIMKKELPQNALIFTNTRHAAAQVAKHLDHNGYKCQYLNGDLPQSKRSRVINSFKSGKLQYLVATDVAARGLHIDDLEMVINFDLPGDSENYVHRIGRTARVGKSGKAISLACENYVFNLEAIESFIGMKIPVQYADDNLYMVDDQGKIVEVDMRPPRRDRDKSRTGASRSRRTKPSRTASSATRSVKKKTVSDKPGDGKKTDGKKEGKRFDRKRTDAKKGNRPKQDDLKLEERTQDERNAENKNKRSGNKPYTKGKPKAKHPEHKEPGDRRHTTKKKSKSSPGTPANAPKKSRGTGKRGNLEDRLEYYKKKYGDNFQVSKPDGGATQSATPPKSQKQSILKRIANVFKRNR